MATKVKLELNRLTDAEIIQKTNTIVEAMTGNANFTTPAPALTAVATAAAAVGTEITERDALASQVQQKTINIRATREILAGILTNLAAYVETTATTAATPANPASAIIESAGMEVAGSSTTPVGPLPRVEGLTASAGDGDGEVDLHWNRIARGLKSYIVQSSDAADPYTGWAQIGICTKSKHTATGLTSGKRYWFRVAALGTAGQGPWSDPATKTAP